MPGEHGRHGPRSGSHGHFTTNAVRTGARRQPERRFVVVHIGRERDDDGRATATAAAVRRDDTCARDDTPTRPGSRRGHSRGGRGCPWNPWNPRHSLAATHRKRHGPVLHGLVAYLAVDEQPAGRRRSVRPGSRRLLDPTTTVQQRQRTGRAVDLMAPTSTTRHVGDLSKQ